LLSETATLDGRERMRAATVGFEHFKAYDFLRDGEVVLTFDDGPWPGNTPAVLKARAGES
jgi:peptidoglycan/xylan/chitin deacetylase (PgdA/CDA1 family)